ncbi:MAG: 30S ribosomal protein S6 [Sedimentisphaerales bacterium]|nr:30S ribosomal protein S6 [Sedimentisphaerales bacterium]
MSNTLKRTYEAMFLVDSATATANWDDVIAEINNLLERAEADVIVLKKWDERRLAFEIAGRKRGTYIITYFKAPPARISGIERGVQLSESLLRVMILQAEHLTEEAMHAATPAIAKESGESKTGDSSLKETQAGFNEKPKRPVPAISILDLDDSIDDDSDILDEYNDDVPFDPEDDDQEPKNLPLETPDTDESPLNSLEQDQNEETEDDNKP